MEEPLRRENNNQRLDSWKEIAAFFDRDERTVKRWEKERGLPVHRVPGNGKRVVFAYSYELRRWLSGAGQNKGIASEPGVTEIKNHPALLVLPAPVTADETPSLKIAKFSIRSVAAVWPRRSAALLLVAASVIGAVAFLTHQFMNRTAHASTSGGFPLSIGPVRHKPAPAAEDLYFKGRYYWDKRTPADLQRAVEFFTQAVVLDPNYAAAYVGLADTYNLQREFADLPPAEAYTRSLAAARRALDIDDSLPEAHRSLAFVLFHGYWDFVAGEREFRRAIELNPNDAEAHHWYATALVELPGRAQDGLAEIETARKLNPGSRSIEADRAIVIMLAGHQEEAMQALLQMESAEPDFFTPYRYLSYMHFCREEFPEYLRQARVAATLEKNKERLASLGLQERAFHTGGKRGLYEEMLNEMTAHPTSSADTADILFHLGRNAEALEYLRQGLRERQDDFFGLSTNLRFQPYRNDPEFREIVSRIGLPSVN